jgi:hypothetical protein
MQGLTCMNSDDFVLEGIIQFQLNIRPVKWVIIGDNKLKVRICDIWAYYSFLRGMCTQTRSYYYSDCDCYQ